MLTTNKAVLKQQMCTHDLADASFLNEQNSSVPAERQVAKTFRYNQIITFR